MGPLRGLAFLFALTLTACSKKPCPDGAEQVGHAPPKGSRQWCHKQAADGGFLKHGASTEWYANGQKMEAGEHREGKRHGQWTRWYDSGIKAWEGSYTDGKRTGRWLRWDGEGAKIGDVEFEDDVAKGSAAGLPGPEVEGGDAGAPASEAPAAAKDTRGGDPDQDWIPQDEDNCPFDSNADQADLDGDKLGDPCDDDMDGDERQNVHDNCPRAANWEQVDLDGDRAGDVCDADLDGDGIPNEKDNCPGRENPDQADANKDGKGDACVEKPRQRLDSDGDGIPDAGPDDRPYCGPGRLIGCFDNCPGIANPDQNLGACNADGDIDGDGISNAQDNCLHVRNPDQKKTRGQAPAEGGDACHLDMDGDGLEDAKDNCALVPNPDQRSATGGWPGDACRLPDLPAAPASSP